MKWVVLLALCLVVLRARAASTTYTEFYCDATASANNTNVNAGSTTGAAVYSSIHGNWDGTSVFIPTDGSTPANTVSAGMWMSVYVDGATNLIQTSSGGWICLITNVAAGVNGAITIDRSAFAGTAPSSSVNARSVKVGGCWQGPYRTISFPFSFIATTATNGASARPRVNFNNANTYNVTAAMTHSVGGPIRFQGYSASPGDAGRATIDGGTSVAGYTVLTITGNHNDFEDFIFSHNGNNGSSTMILATTSARCYFKRITVSVARGIGFNVGNHTLVQCEATGCNASGTAATGAFNVNASTTFIRCYAHDNNGSGSSGFKATTGTMTFDHCNASANAVDGVAVSGATVTAIFTGCDFYNNGTAGIEGQADNQTLYIENCNFLRGTYGLFNSSTLRNGAIVNCGFGSGTQANNSGDIVSPGGIQQVNNISYAANVTPWVDPDNDDFRISLPAAKAAGIGAFTQSTGTTIGYPDIGAAQSASTNGGFAGTFAQ